MLSLISPIQQSLEMTSSSTDFDMTSSSADSDMPTNVGSGSFPFTINSTPTNRCDRQPIHRESGLTLPLSSSADFDMTANVGSDVTPPLTAPQRPLEDVANIPRQPNSANETPPLTTPKRPLGDVTNMPRQFKSARAMNKDELTKVLIHSNQHAETNTQAPLTWNWHATKSALAMVYTSKSGRIDQVLQYFQHDLEFCPIDSITRLQEWGQLPRKYMAERLKTFIDQQPRDMENIETTGTGWNATMNCILSHLYCIFWPKSSQKISWKKATKHRCVIGIRYKYQPNMKTEQSPLHISSATDWETMNAPNIKYEQGTQSLPRSKNQTLSGIFTPYYDILQNDTVYVVRTILPLMSSSTANSLSISANLGHRTCTVKGSYIPSTLIGTEPAKSVRLKQPLLAVHYSPRTTTGAFQLDIALPSDIRDEEDQIKVIHDCWGILLCFPRRKITHDANIQLASCFGLTRLGASNPPQTPSPQISLVVPPRTPQTPPPPVVDTTSIDVSDAEILMGKVIHLPGHRWGNRYKGKTYEGVIDKHYKQDGYVLWEAFFNDCRETFYLEELLEFALISQEQFDQLKGTCQPAATPEQPVQTTSINSIQSSSFLCQSHNIPITIEDGRGRIDNGTDKML